METEIQRVRELERAVVQDVKNANNIVEIRQIAESASQHRDLRVAAIHSLRRVFVEFAESDKLLKKSTSSSSSSSSNNKNKNKFYLWFVAQYQEYEKLLCTVISDPLCVWGHEISIRTMLELVKFDHLIYSEELKPKYLASGSDFGIKTFRLLLDALIVAKNEVDVDLVLMLKDEYFIYNDFTYYTLLHLKTIILNLKDDFQAFNKKVQFSNVDEDCDEFKCLETRKKNIVDFMRIVAVPLDTEDDSSFYVLPKSSSRSDESDEDSVSGESEDEEEEESTQKVAGKKMLGKRKTDSEEMKSKKKAKKLTETDRLRSVLAYQKLFSKAWLSLLSLPFSLSEHKILLKHLPDNVVSYLVNPLLLADYLTQSYNCGGAVAVLALESLFHLIAKYNLDYPNFFASMYKLCTVENFNAKYSGKFMKLLHASLKSTNLPAYLVAAFIKRLAHLALHASSTRAAFCVSQICWLLKQHRSCQILVQRTKLGESCTTDGQFNNSEETNLEICGALQSSLWELELLQNHHVYEVTQLAKALQDPESTSVGAFPINVEQYISQNYADMFEMDLNKPKGKKNAELGYKKPESLMPPSKFVGSTFG